MSKIFKYIKNQNYVFLCENMYLPKSPSPDHDNVHGTRLSGRRHKFCLTIICAGTVADSQS